MDCRASVTITGSLLNCEDVDVKITKIEAAKEAESILASHACRKTHFVRNRLGEFVSITTCAIYVKGFPQDLLGGKSLNKETVRVILDGDPHISGLYPLDGKQEPQFKDSIPFFSEPTDLFYLQTEKMLLLVVMMKMITTPTTTTTIIIIIT
jgi:hypothetical protein